jgi:hypothetical protein
MTLETLQTTHPLPTISPDDALLYSNWLNSQPQTTMPRLPGSFDGQARLCVALTIANLLHNRDTAAYRLPDGLTYGIRSYVRSHLNRLDLPTGNFDAANGIALALNQAPAEPLDPDHAPLVTITAADRDLLDAHDQRARYFPVEPPKQLRLVLALMLRQFVNGPRPKDGHRLALPSGDVREEVVTAACSYLCSLGFDATAQPSSLHVS